ncbi:MAG: hypothetical protein ACI8XO_003555 [Verrucomicrobiales bacterium]|jgi:hypothetical protein
MALISVALAAVTVVASVALGGDATAVSVFKILISNVPLTLCAFMSLASGSLFFLMLLKRMAGHQVLQISVSTIRLPNGLIRKRAAEIEFNDIVRLSETRIGKKRFLLLFTAAEKHSLAESLMPTSADYENAKRIISLGFAANKALNPTSDME